MKMKIAEFLVAVGKRHGQVLRRHCAKFLASEEGKSVVQRGYVKNPSGVIQEVLWQSRARGGHAGRPVSEETLQEMRFGSKHRVTLA